MIYSYQTTVITAPASEPVTTAEAKSWGNITTSADDTLIDAMIASARIAAEEYMGRAIITQTLDTYFQDFSTNMGIKRGGVTAISSIKYQDVNDSEQTLSTSSYETTRNLTADSKNPAKIKILTAPSTYADGLENVVVRYVAGYASAAAVPDLIKTAIKTRVITWYENRQETVTGTQVNDIGMQWGLSWFENMLSPYRVIDL